MRAVTIGQNEAGQRLDKFLNKYMKEAGVSFFYKMMRKKNIVLNGKKCTGKEILLIGDEVKLFLAEETLEKFGAPPADYSAQKKATGAETKEYLLAFEKLKNIRILYEDEDILALDKPAGVLSQKASVADFSANEWLIGYLLSQKKLRSLFCQSRLCGRQLCQVAIIPLFWLTRSRFHCFCLLFGLLGVCRGNRLLPDWRS